MNIGNTEKIIALDPLDIKEYRPWLIIFKL
jgi:hypothetical protein